MAIQVPRAALDHTSDLIIAAKPESVVLEALERILENSAEAKNSELKIELQDHHGENVKLPESLIFLLRQVVPQLLAGHAVALVPLHKELTTQEAADLLGVSRPFLIGLLERGEIPYAMTGKHRRIRLDDLLRYKTHRDATRRQALDRLTEISQEYGLDRYPD